MTEESLGTEKLEDGTGEAIAAIKDKNMPLMGLIFFFYRDHWKYRTVSRREADAKGEWDGPMLATYSRLIALQPIAAIIFPFIQNQNVLKTCDFHI